MSASDHHAHRTGGDIARGLLALLVVLLLLGGVPAALLQVADSPLPHHVLTLDAFRAALTAPDDGSLFLRALALAAWLGWATFALALLVEVPAQLRGHRTPRLPALAVQQRTASRLVASISVLVSAPTLVAVPPTYALIATSSPPAVAAPSVPAGTAGHTNQQPSAVATASPPPESGNGRSSPRWWCTAVAA